tara:strand:+ start:602 stop:901 length:300 start_codon:yes stop_codon:yes gene_type:complete
MSKKEEHNNIINTDIEEPKKRAYMRKWKQNDYINNGTKIKAKNRAYYYKYKFGFSSESMKKYDIHLPLVARIIDNLNKLKNENPDLISEVLQNYTNENK